MKNNSVLRKDHRQRRFSRLSSHTLLTLQYRLQSSIHHCHGRTLHLLITLLLHQDLCGAVSHCREEAPYHYGFPKASAGQDDVCFSLMESQAYWVHFCSPNWASEVFPAGHDDLLSVFCLLAETNLSGTEGSARLSSTPTGLIRDFLFHPCPDFAGRICSSLLL